MLCLFCAYVCVWCARVCLCVSLYVCVCVCVSVSASQRYHDTDKRTTVLLPTCNSPCNVVSASFIWCSLSSLLSLLNASAEFVIERLLNKFHRLIPFTAVVRTQPIIITIIIRVYLNRLELILSRGCGWLPSRRRKRPLHAWRYSGSVHMCFMNKSPTRRSVFS